MSHLLLLSSLFNKCSRTRGHRPQHGHDCASVRGPDLRQGHVLRPQAASRCHGARRRHSLGAGGEEVRHRPEWHGGVLPAQASTRVSAAVWTFQEGARPVPPPHAASISHLLTDRAATRRGAEPHPPCLRPHALIGAGECAVALYGVDAPPLPRLTAAAFSAPRARGARSPRAPPPRPSAARLPLLTAQTARQTQAAGWTAMGSVRRLLSAGLRGVAASDSQRLT